jgi:3-deoxy-D-manno-octulosonic-acid transferase
MSELLQKPENVTSLGVLARTTVRQVSGASQRNVEHMARVLAR